MLQTQQSLSAQDILPPSKQTSQAGVWVHLVTASRVQPEVSIRSNCHLLGFVFLVLQTKHGSFPCLHAACTIVGDANMSYYYTCSQHTDIDCVECWPGGVASGSPLLAFFKSTPCGRTYTFIYLDCMG